MIVSETAYIWFVTGMVLLISVGWGAVDSVRLRRELSRRNREPDRIFGSIIGIVLGTIGLLGAIMYYLDP
jgi:hypothetical protein